MKLLLILLVCWLPPQAFEGLTSTSTIPLGLSFSEKPKVIRATYEKKILGVVGPTEHARFLKELQPLFGSQGYKIHLTVRPTDVVPLYRLFDNGRSWTTKSNMTLSTESARKWLKQRSTERGETISLPVMAAPPAPVPVYTPPPTVAPPPQEIPVREFRVATPLRDLLLGPQINCAPDMT